MIGDRIEKLIHIERIVFGASPARQMNELAVELQAQGRCQEALNAFIKAAQFYRAEGDAKGEGRCLNGVGACYKDIGETDRARTYLEDALKLRIRTGDRLGEAITLTTLGPIYQTLGEPDQAQRVLNTALRITETLGAYNRYGQVLFNLAEVALTSGRVAQAQTWYELARSAAQDTGNDVEAAKCLGGLTNVAMRLGLRKEAFEYARQYMQESREAGDARGVSCAYHALASLFYGEREYDKARIALQESIDIDTETGAPAEAVISTCLLADVLRAVDQTAEARRLTEEALADAKRLQAPKSELRALETLAAIASDEGENSAALELSEQVLAAARRLGDRVTEAWTLSHIALLYDRLRRRPEAFTLLEQAATILDEIRSSISHDPHRLAFFSQRDVQSVYSIYVDLLLKEWFASGERALAERAFAVRERSHTRALLDLLYSKGKGTPETLGAYSVTLSEAQQLLDAQTVLVEYSVHKGVSYAFVVTCDDWRVVKLPSSNDIRHAVAPESGLTIQGDVSMLRRAARSVYTTAFAPIEPEFGGRTRVIVVPDDVLVIVPFQMLRSSDDPSSWLLKRYTFSYAPSASLIHALQRGPNVPPMEFLGLAPMCDRDLPATKTEVTNIGRMFEEKTTIRTGADATKAELASLKTSDYRFIHFATHGLCDVMDQNGSALMLHGESRSEQLLYTHEIADMTLNADMVVLSACETGLGVATHGEGLLGLARAFLSAGAAVVCATLWEIADDTTAELMQRFYRCLQESTSPATALRMAQLEVLANPRWADPQFWAAFIVIGRP